MLVISALHQSAKNKMLSIKLSWWDEEIYFNYFLMDTSEANIIKIQTVFEYSRDGWRNKINHFYTFNLNIRHILVRLR